MMIPERQRICRLAVLEEAQYLIEQSRSPRLRSLEEFAEQEIVLPNGPFKGMRLRRSMQPAHFLWFALIDSQRWSRHAYVGPVQSGKTMAALVIPLMHTLFERQETAILGAPKMEIAQDKWREDFLPVILASRYAQLLPRIGSGSRGGKPADHVAFLNGVTLKFMSGSGSDDSRSAYTARYVFVTETDKMDQAGGGSREADPVSQLEDRTFAFDRHGGGRIFLECTASHSEGRIWREYEAGTGSRLALPCPHCRTYVLPGREHFGGHEEAETEEEAAELGRFSCPACGETWSQEERLAAAASAVVVHRGQRVDKRGRVSGDPPATRTLGFRVTAAENAFVSDGSIAAREWRAGKLEEQSAARENEEKTLRQKVWALPYDAPLRELTPLSEEAVRQRGEGWPRGVLPPDTQRLTVGVDVGKWRAWWLVIAFRASGAAHVPAYGQLDVCHDPDDVAEIKLLAALREFRAVLEAGFPLAGTSEMRTPDAVWIDQNYLGAVVRQFTREAGAKYVPVTGRGTTQMGRLRYSHPRRTGSEVRKLGQGWHLRRNAQERSVYAMADADFWKSWIHERLTTKAGERGGLSLYLGTANEHGKLSRHLTSEKQVQQFVAGRGWEPKWENPTGADNHWLDCAAYAAAAGDYCGWRFEQPAEAAPGRRAQWFGRQKTSSSSEAPEAAPQPQPAAASKPPEHAAAGKPEARRGWWERRRAARERR